MKRDWNRALSLRIVLDPVLGPRPCVVWVFARPSGFPELEWAESFDHYGELIDEFSADASFVGPRVRAVCKPAGMQG